MTVYPVDQAVELHAAAMALHASGRARAALAPCRQALAILERECGGGHPDVAAVLLALGRLHEDVGEPGEAEDAFRRADAVLERHARERDPVLVRLRVRARAGVAGVLCATGRLEEAELLFLQAVELAARELGGDDAVLASVFNGIGVVYRRQGRLDDAELVHRRALALTEVEPVRVLDAADVCLNLAELEHERGRFDAGVAHAERALALRAQALGDDHPAVAAVLVTLGRLHQGAGRLAEAARRYEQALELLAGAEVEAGQAGGPALRLVGACWHGLAEIAAAGDDLAEAEARYRQALAVRERAFGPDSPEAAATLRGLGLVLAARGQFDDAVRLLYRAHDLYEDLFGPSHALTTATAADLARLT